MRARGGWPWGWLLLVAAALCWDSLGPPLRQRARRLAEPRPVVSSTLLLQAFREVSRLAGNSSGAAGGPPLNATARAGLHAFYQAQLQSAPRGSLLDWLPAHGRDAFCGCCRRRPQAQASRGAKRAAL